MSLDALKEQAARLLPSDRRRLVAYLVALEDAQSGDYRARLRQKIDDQSPDHWLTLEQMEARLGLGKASQ